MLYGDAKQREIARSVLPSKNRKTARADFARVHRRSRRAVRTDLRVVARGQRAPGVVDAWDEAHFDPVDCAGAEIIRLMWRRRDSDKLGPLFRWATAVTADVPLEDRLAVARRLFADNLIGRHAVGHLAATQHFRIPYVHDQRWRWRRFAQPAPRPNLAALVRQCLLDGDHAALNRWMRRHPTDDGEVRLLAGLHDVEAFAAACAAEPAWRRALTRFGGTEHQGGPGHG